MGGREEGTREPDGEPAHEWNMLEGGLCRCCKGGEPGLQAPHPDALFPPPLHPMAHPHPTPLTHPEVVEALGHAEMLRRNVCLKVLVETWLQGDEFGQRWEVVHFLCG